VRVFAAETLRPEEQTLPAQEPATYRSQRPHRAGPGRCRHWLLSTGELCRIAAWAVLKGTPARHSCVPKVCRRAAIKSVSTRPNLFATNATAVLGMPTYPFHKVDNPSPGGAETLFHRSPYSLHIHHLRGFRTRLSWEQLPECPNHPGTSAGSGWRHAYSRHQSVPVESLKFLASHPKKQGAAWAPVFGWPPRHSARGPGRRPRPRSRGDAGARSP
jgi:hypothetical protein